MAPTSPDPFCLPHFKRLTRTGVGCDGTKRPCRWGTGAVVSTLTSAYGLYFVASLEKVPPSSVGSASLSLGASPGAYTKAHLYEHSPCMQCAFVYQLQVIRRPLATIGPPGYHFNLPTSHSAITYISACIRQPLWNSRLKLVHSVHTLSSEPVSVSKPPPSGMQHQCGLCRTVPGSFVHEQFYAR